MENANKPEAAAADIEQTSAQQTTKDVLDQLINPEVQASLNALLEQLPKLTEMMTTITKTYDLCKPLSMTES